MDFLPLSIDTFYDNKIPINRLRALRCQLECDGQTLAPPCPTPSRFPDLRTCYCKTKSKSPDAKNKLTTIITRVMKDNQKDRPVRVVLVDYRERSEYL